MLASIQIIKNVRPHPNASRLDVYQVLGWQCLGPKGEFQIGDPCLFLRIDSIIPDDATWLPPSFKKDPNGKNIIVKTIKMFGELSQGLVIHPNFLINHIFSGNSEILKIFFSDIDFLENIGFDLTDILGIKKVEEHFEANGGMFDPRIPSTDIHRIQENPNIVASLSNCRYYTTLKIDGMSSTFHRDVDGLKIYSKNYLTRDPTFVQAAQDYDLDNKLANYPNYAFQGEIYGPKIQNNYLNVKKVQIAFFKIFNIEEKRFCNLDEFLCIMEILDLPHVPIIYRGENFNESSNLEQLLEQAKGFYPNTTNVREGLVYNNFENTICFKVINNDFLLIKNKKSRKCK